MTRRTTIMVAPHQDDDLRLAAYALRCADRGDLLYMICSTDGAATRQGQLLGLDAPKVTTVRDREARNAWEWMTFGQGEPLMSLGLPDGATNPAMVTAALNATLDTLPLTDDVEIYSSTWHYDRDGAVNADQHVDHRAVRDAVMTVAASRGWAARYARHHTALIQGAWYRPRDDRDRIHLDGAIGSYAPIGQKSASQTFAYIAEHGLRTRVTP